MPDLKFHGYPVDRELVQWTRDDRARRRARRAQTARPSLMRALLRGRAMAADVTAIGQVCAPAVDELTGGECSSHC